MQKPLLLKLVGCALFLVLCSCVCFAGVFVLATRTNTNIPVVSDLAEKAENMFVSEENFKQEFIDAIKEIIQNPESTYVPREGSTTSKISFKVASEQMGQPIKLSGEGNFDWNNDSTAGNMDLKLNLDVADVKVDSNMSFRTFIREEKWTETFAKVEKIPAFLSMMVPGVDQYSNKWLYFGSNKTEDMLAPLNNDPKLKANLLEFVDTQEFRNLFSRNSERVIDNKRTRCFGINADKEKVLAAMNKYAQISGEKSNEEIVDQFTMTAEACFGKGDAEVYYLNFNVKSDVVEAELIWDNFQYSNTKLNVQKPTMYIDLTKQLPMPTP